MKTTYRKLLLFTSFIVIKTIHGLQRCDDPEAIESSSRESSPISSPHHSRLRGLFPFDPKSVESKTTRGGGVCDGYNGILKINSGDPYAASGTAFFIYVVGQILYAEQHNLVPWVHFEWQDSSVYDREVHIPPPSTEEGGPVCFEALVGTEVTMETGEGEDGCDYPGAPDYERSNLTLANLRLDTSGVWEHYFEPITYFRPKEMTPSDIESCAHKPFVDLETHHLWPGIHSCAPWGLRSWAYHGLPKKNGPDWENEPVKTYYNWMGRMRDVGHRVVSQYFYPKPWLIQKVDEVNPLPSSSDASPPCLAMHVRHSDKGGARRKIGLDEFYPYATAFLENGGRSIYVATDTLDNIGRIDWDWPKEVANYTRWNREAFFVKGRKPVFAMLPHHRSNTEALIDIYAMARCGFILHGFSGLSEASIYIGDLHRNSVNLEDEERASVEEFAAMVRERLHHD